MNPAHSSGQEREVLGRLIGEVVSIETQTRYAFFHGDDTDRSDPPNQKREGTLAEVLDDGVIVTGDGEGFPRMFWKDGLQHYQSFRGTGRAYFPFMQETKTELSAETSGIVSISHGCEVVYRR